MSSNSGPDSATGASALQAARTKLSAIQRLRSFGESFISTRESPPPIVFPPPSWELSDELLGKRRSPTLLESNYETRPKVDAPEAVPFAKRLRALIESLPISLPGTSSIPTTDNTTEQGAPVPPGMDEGLVRMLSDEDVMNGRPSSATNEQEHGRPGIWSILASLRRDDGRTTPRPGAVESEEGGMMVYSPLEPKNDSQVELAESETVDEPHASPKPGEPQKQTTMWVPSTTELSVLTTWWGYRLYLPPPVMARLDGTSMQATARAAMITAALKWMLDKIPIMLVPVQFRPAVKLLKNLSPLVGYVGVFIAWSWDRVRACDKGNGVVLTATWLLPVALLPMSWDAGDIYGPRPPLTTEATAAARAAAEEAEAADSGKDKEQGKKPRSIFRW